MVRTIGEKRKEYEVEFTLFFSDKYKKRRALCKYCNIDMAESPRQATHLVNCTPYQDSMITRQKETLFTAQRKTLNKDQTRLMIPTLTEYQKHQFDLKATMAIIMGARSFRTFADPYMYDFITTISANTYEPPSERAIGSKLLDECYDSCKSKVTAILAK
jgi:hypothetical protein